MRFVGIDWGNKKHAVCMVDGEGKVVAQAMFDHDAGGLSELFAWITDHAGDCDVKVGMETPRGPLVEALLDREVAVFAVNPKQLDRFRDRFGAAGAKDDRRDARVIADSLRTDERAFRAIEPSLPWVAELRELSRMREDLVHERVALVNGIREQLGRYFPQMLELVTDIDAAWVHALIQAAPTPAQAAVLPRAKLERLLGGVRRFTVDEARALLKSPGFKVSKATTVSASRRTQSLMRRLGLIHDEIHMCDQAIERLLAQQTSPEPSESSEGDDAAGQQKEQRDVVVLQSLPGVGSTILATLLGEAWELLRHRDYNALRAYAGVAPVTRQSGKQRSVVRRYACNTRLANAVFNWARCVLSRDAVSKAKYSTLRQRGHSHGRAIRAVADRLLSVACAMLRSGKEFDPGMRELLTSAG